MNEENISRLDKNFAAEEITYHGIKFHNIKEKPFKVYGLYRPHEEDVYKRMPEKVALQVNEQVSQLYLHTSGGRIRFRTDSTKILLRSILPKITKHVHMPQTGVACFDLYVDGEYWNPFKHGVLAGVECDSEAKFENVYDSNLTIGEKKMRDVLIHFPLYNRVDDVYIGLDDDASIEEATEYTHTKPVVFYGSSITQGACASHPGNAYANLIAMHYDTDILNLGFSSGCKGEDIMAEYIAGLEMGVLVYDYDHNAGSAEHLAKTHERVFEIIREKHPELPVIIVTAADRFFGTVPERKEVIRRTYDHAIAAGDKHVYFVDGETIYAPVGRKYCTVDHVHPNDIGFYLMYQAIGKVVGDILNKG